MFLLNFSNPSVTLPALKETYMRQYEKMAKILREDFEEREIEDIHRVLCELPTVCVEIILRGEYANNDVDRVVKQPATRDHWLEINANQVNLFKL